jgi:hypothetical protein
MRETCGAACGLFMLAGLQHSATDGADRKTKQENYELVQKLAAEFKHRNGALRCADLLGPAEAKPVSAVPEARTAAYYAKRPCSQIVEEAARIWGEYLEAQQ